MKHLSFIFILFFSLSLNAQNNSSINMNINMNMGGNNEQPAQNQNTDMNINLNMEEGNQNQPANNQNQAVSNTAKPVEAVVYVSGYSGKIGCTPPVSADRIKDMANTIENQSFSDDKVRVSKQIIRTNCITLDQLLQLLEQFDFDGGKLEIAKFAYDYVYDLENYYKVYNVFSFSSSGKELDEYIQSKN